jgi:hypothetical protein
VNSRLISIVGTRKNKNSSRNASKPYNNSARNCNTKKKTLIKTSKGLLIKSVNPVCNALNIL